MTDTRRAGFTLLEIMIVAAVVSVLAILLYTPIVNGLVMVQRENTLMNMFRAGDSVMSRLAANLQQAILPIPTDGSAAANNNNTGNTSKPYQRVINSTARGFWTNGRNWRTALMNGTDFLPFCTPVTLGNTNSAVDSDGLPVLGITMPNGNRVISANYTQSVLADGTVEYTLGNRNIHPALAALSPADFGIATGTPPALTSITDARFAQRLVFPANSNRGYAVIRFVPKLDDNGNPVVLSEATLDADLNQDGTKANTFAQGSLVIEYANDSSDGVIRNVQSLFPMVNQSILLQLDTDADSYVPIFKLVGGFTGGNSPSGTTWTESTTTTGNTYILLVRLLLFDFTTQQGTVMATGRQRDGRQFITRQFQTFIEMRNMAIE